MLKMDVNMVSVLLSTGPILEVASYPKPGNVHRLRDFTDTRFEDFLVSSLVLVPFIAKGVKRGFKGVFNKIVVGDLIYNITRYSMSIHGGGNTCLGVATLLTPLAIASGFMLKKRGDVDVSVITKEAEKLVRKYTTVYDSIHFYKAIRYIKPSYISLKDETYGFPNILSKNYKSELLSRGLKLWDILKLSAKFDIVSKEVVEGYPLSLDAMKFLEQKLNVGIDWNNAVLDTYLYMLSRVDDTLVLRKFGRKLMRVISRRAKKILEAGGSKTTNGYKMIIKLDKYLEAKNVNPGATADIIATAISLYSLKTRRSIIRPY